jgi:hypothetical protein
LREQGSLQVFWFTAATQEISSAELRFVRECGLFGMPC